MLFVVRRHQLQWNISLARDDRRKDKMKKAGPYMRLEAKDDYLKLDGLEVSAKFPATVYEAGVLFLKITIFRRLLRTLKGQPFITVQVADEELLLDRIRLPLDCNDMLLYTDPDQAPAQHPSTRFVELPRPRPKPEFRQLLLWNLAET